MSDGWKLLADELARWADEPRKARFWWRDDDATREHPALERLVGISESQGIALGLAVVPLGVDPAMLSGLPSTVAILQHGCDHANRALSGMKKCEFPESLPTEVRLARLVEARTGLNRASGARALPVLVPPWNRLDDALARRLPAAGYSGLSRFKARAKTQAIPGLLEFNTHADLMNWHGLRGFAGDDAVLHQLVSHLWAKRTDPAVADEPTGLLTHHRVHDAEAWDFLARLFDFTRGRDRVLWCDPLDLFKSK